MERPSDRSPWHQRGPQAWDARAVEVLDLVARGEQVGRGRDHSGRWRRPGTEPLARLPVVARLVVGHRQQEVVVAGQLSPTGRPRASAIIVDWRLDHRVPPRLLRFYALRI